MTAATTSLMGRGGEGTAATSLTRGGGGSVGCLRASEETTAAKLNGAVEDGEAVVDVGEAAEGQGGGAAEGAES